MGTIAYKRLLPTSKMRICVTVATSVLLLFCFSCVVVPVTASSPNNNNGYQPRPPPPPKKQGTSSASNEYYSEYYDGYHGAPPPVDAEEEEFGNLPFSPPPVEHQQATTDIDDTTWLPPPPPDMDEGQQQPPSRSSSSSTSSYSIGQQEEHVEEIDPRQREQNRELYKQDDDQRSYSSPSTEGKDENRRRGGPGFFKRRSQPPPNSSSASSSSSPATTTTSTASTSGGRPGSTTNSFPINYQFPAKEDEDFGDIDDEDDMRRPDDQNLPKTASPRKDIVTQYMSTSTGKLKVFTTSSIVGSYIGYYLARSLLPVSVLFMSTSSAIACIIFTFLRTPIGELMRAVSLSFLLVLQRTKQIRQKYPTWKYVPGTITGRRPNHGRDRFPPRTNNPWKYKPRHRDDVDFNMMYSIIAMGFVGSTCGGNIPLVPSWMGALAGAAIFALSCLQPNPRGDLSRTLGMRVIALLQELWEIQAQLKLIPKAAVVSGQIIDRAMILDRKHRVKDRFLSLVTASYNRVMEMTSTTGEGRDERSRRGRGEGPEENRRRRRETPTRDDDNSSKNYDDDGRGRRGRSDDDDEDYRRRRSGPPSSRRGGRRDDDGDDEDFRRRRQPGPRQGGDERDDDDYNRRRQPDNDFRSGDERRRYDTWRDQPGDDGFDNEQPKKGRFGRMFGK